jgi:predicted dehydrogenase
MGDLGMHVVHLPFRLGWMPASVYAQLVNVVTERPDGRGGMAPCDTWDNAILHTNVAMHGSPVPMTLEMKRMAPGETNSWYIDVLGMEGAVRYSTKEPKTFWSFQREKEQWWRKTDLGFQTPFPTITGGIFEPGFPDAILQMWAAFVAEREGFLGDRFGCVTPEEAVASHLLFYAALESQHGQRVVEIAPEGY